MNRLTTSRNGSFSVLAILDTETGTGDAIGVVARHSLAFRNIYGRNLENFMSRSY